METQKKISKKNYKAVEKEMNKALKNDNFLHITEGYTLCSNVKISYTNINTVEIECFYNDENTALLFTTDEEERLFVTIQTTNEGEYDGVFVRFEQ